jgi:MYXO-CTERM domain-containing protein
MINRRKCVHLSKTSKAALIATALMTLPSAAIAAQSGADQTRTTTTTQQQRDDDRDFPWGLLGLLGLAGLLGLRKNKERDIHVDARRDHDTTRPRP